MKNIWNIYRTDMKNICTNWVVIILIGGLAILPSLYAWFNIKAAWDPYAQTDQIPVGIVNEDTGSTIRDEEIHVGDEIVKSLKENDSLSWQFVTHDEAMDQIDRGKLFAVIVIPEDFSNNLATVVEKTQKQATVEYFVNEKINAISPKITEKGASVLVEEISGKFIGTVNGTIFEVFNDLGIELENELPDIERFKEYLLATEEELPNIYNKLEETLSDSNAVGDILEDIDTQLPKVKQIVGDAIDIVSSTINKVDEVEEFLNSLIPEIETELEKIKDIQSTINKTLENDYTKEIEDLLNPDSLTELENNIDTTINIIQKIKDTVNQAHMDVDAVNEQIEKANELLPEGEEIKPINGVSTEEINTLLEQLETIEKALQSVQNEISELKDFEPGLEEGIGQLRKINDAINQAQNDLDGFINEFETKLVPQIEKKITVVKDTLRDGKDILLEVQDTLPLIEEIVHRTQENLKDGQVLLSDVMNEYPYVYGKIQEISERVQEMDEKMDLEELINLLQHDPDDETNFFERPVLLEEEALYPIPNYGAGMTPFYTALSLWVGALLLISLVSANVNDRGYKPFEVYFGRYLTFLTIGLIQALIVSLGNIYLLNVYIKEPLYFVLLAMFISFVFMTIVYTFVSVFGDVGKAFAIILLVLQIAGSGGTYPVVLLPPFFQSIHPFLPFTYGVNILREALGGIIWSQVFKGIGILLIFVIACIVLAVFLKGPINKRQEIIMKKSKESGLFD